jgi:hypothetical protein
MTEPTPSRLCALPNKILNEICRRAVVPDNPVTIPPNFKQPALTQVNRQLRATARSIYYKQSDFIVVVKNYDNKPFRLWLAIASKVGPRMADHVTFLVYPPTDPDLARQNLLRWAKSVIQYFTLGMYSRALRVPTRSAPVLAEEDESCMCRLRMFFDWLITDMSGEIEEAGIEGRSVLGWERKRRGVEAVMDTILFSGEAEGFYT